MKRICQWMLPLALAASAPTAGAADSDVRDHPGYVDFSGLTGMANVEPMVEISLKEPLLAMITNFISEEDKEVGSFVSKLIRVTVHVFESGAFEPDEAIASMSDIGAGLEMQGWERVVRLRESGDYVDIFMRMSSDARTIHGITIMAAEPEDTVLVNIVGDIDSEDISALGRRFDIEELVDLDVAADSH